MSDAPNPHDRLFKAIFSHPGHSDSALRSVLPAPLADAVDWATLVHRPGDFAGAQQPEQRSDLLFSATVQGGGEAPVYFLFEHQSTPEPRMEFRLLRYLVRIWERWRKNHGNRVPLPPVVPVVLYHGDTRWSAPSFEALIALPNRLQPILQPYVPSFRYVVDDLTRVTDESLRARPLATPLVTVTLACLEHGRSSEDAVRMIEPWTDLLTDVARVPADREALEHVLRYIAEVTQRPDLGTLRAYVYDRIGPEAEDAMATIAEQLIEQGIERGIEKGIEQGIEQGMEQGELKGKRELLLRQLRQRFGDDASGGTERRIATATGEQLDAWAGRVLSATGLAEVFAD